MTVLYHFVQVAQSAQFPEGTRQLAAEFLLTLCEAREKAPGMMRKLPQYISQLFSCMLLFLLDVTVRLLCPNTSLAISGVPSWHITCFHRQVLEPQFTVPCMLIHVWT